MINILSQSVSVIAHTNSLPATFLITEIAETCYQSDINPDRATNFCQTLLKKGHDSPFEFFHIIFDIVTSRAVANELVRHRMASYMQESQRYVSYEKELPVIRPQGISDENLPDWSDAMESGWAHYCKLLSKGVKKEDARTVLPTAVATHIKASFNLRSFRNFIRLRTGQSAWLEMRQLAHLCASEACRADETILPLISDVWRKE